MRFILSVENTAKNMDVLYQKRRLYFGLRNTDFLILSLLYHECALDNVDYRILLVRHCENIKPINNGTQIFWQEITIK
jgi:hypothetical protein